MDQANSVHSTPPTNTPVDPTRRRFLSQAAAVVAGSAVLTGAVVAPALAIAAPMAVPDATKASPALPVASPRPSSDGELLKLVDDYIAAEKKWCDLTSQVDEMESANWGRPVPDVLHWSEADAELGLPRLYAMPDDHPPIWDRPIDVNCLRDPKWWQATVVNTVDENSYCARAFVPSDAARARADEIIAAYDLWRAERHKRPRGYRKMVRERNKAERAYMRIEKQIAATRATTLEGMMAKIRCAVAYDKTDKLPNLDQGGAGEAMALSIFADLRELGKRIGCLK